jgi:hypothetical protein
MINSPTKEQRLELLRSLDERVGRGESVMEMEIPASVIADIKLYQAQYRKELRQKQYAASEEVRTADEMLQIQEDSRQRLIKTCELARVDPKACSKEIAKRMNYTQ